MAKISANLPDEDLALLRELSKELGISMTDVLRRGIRTEKWFKTLQEEKSTLLVKDEKGNISRVLVKN